MERAGRLREPYDELHPARKGAGCQGRYFRQDAAFPNSVQLAGRRTTIKEQSTPLVAKSWRATARGLFGEIGPPGR